MTAPGQTRMCNAALVHLGESKRIGAINDGTPLARVFESLWDETRDEVLADHPWNFALARKAIPASGDYEAVGEQWAYAYELPADCIRWLPYRTDHPDYFAGEQEGRFILSSADAPLNLRYIRQVEDVAEWPPGFRAAMSAKLAFKAAKPITGQSGMIDKMAALYDEELRKAKRQDGAATGERGRTADYRSDWLAARQRPYGAN